MDYTFTFKISKETISINTTKRAIDKKGLNNTNVIDTQELKFSPEYIIENKDLVSTFLNVIILKQDINTCNINTMDCIDHILDLVNTWEKITKITFKEDETINYSTFMKLLENNYLKELECYNMPPYLVERLDMNKHIKIRTREKYDNNSRFMKENFLNSYSDIFYKKTIIITSTFNDKEIQDFRNFMAINNNLKQIRFISYTNEAMAIVLNEIKKYQKKNVTIIMDERNNDLNVIYSTIPYLKKTYKKYVTDYNIKFKVNYSFEYRKNNFMKEFNLKILTSIILIIIVILLVIFGINSYKEYRDTNKVEDQMNEINDILKEFTINDGNQDDVDVIGTQTPQKSNYSTLIIHKYLKNYIKLIQTLLDG